ncbi:hypothetical protein LTS18_009373 [Coniosporium uncinatum]|uniref:Uncharacterized protein n=1 Tax=Coniosporium uncinatum TaxID=93489 RepID=A0ACC3DWV7_9PEZI|nr:hypothetical protein LTS18_009373 [Coniosporium uncinatum]
MVSEKRHMSRPIETVEHHENVDSDGKEASLDSTEVHGFTADQATLQPGYFYSSFFLGTMAATGLGLAAAVGGFGLAAPNLALINNDIGPDPNIVWVSLVYTLTLAVGLILVGRLSDLFGRRWFFIGSAALALIGCVICATAQNIGSLIGGTTLIGLAASGQQSFAFITGELVPMKHRFAANAVMYVFCLPFGGFGPAVSKAFILYTSAGWRWAYYIMIIINFISGLLFYFFYFPPTFHMKFQERTVMQQLRDFDYVGTVLFVAGFTLFLLGLSWGGGENYAKLKEPLLPIHLFKNFSWVAACILLGLGASIYYAMAIIWPQMVAVLYTNDGGASMYAGWLSCAPSVMINAGQIVAGFAAEPIGKTKIQCISVLIIGGALIGAIAAVSNVADKSAAIALIILGCFFIGWNESVCLSNAGIELLDQREIGTAVGAAGSIRSAISSVASAVYLSVLSNRLTATVPAIVPPAVIAAGLPASSVTAFLQGLTTGSFTGVPGLTDSILAVGTTAYKTASADAYSTVFFTTIAFTGISVVTSFFSPNVDSKMTGQVAVTLGKKEVEQV